MTTRHPKPPTAKAASRRRLKLDVRAIVAPPAPDQEIVATIERALKRKLVETEIKKLAHFCVDTTRMFSGPFEGEASAASGPGEVLAPQWYSFETDGAGSTVGITTHWPSAALDEKQRAEALALLEQAEASLGGRRHIARLRARGEITEEEHERRRAQTLEPDGSHKLRIELTECHLADLRKWIERMPPGRGRQARPNATGKCIEQVRRLMHYFSGLSQAKAIAVVVSLARPFDDSIEEASVQRVLREKKAKPGADR